MLLAAAALAGCGDDSGDDEQASAPKPAQNASSLACMEKSVLAARAAQAEKKARANESIEVDDPSAIVATNKTLMIDYSTDEHVGKIVTACARNPERPPPTP